ncbi:hypothetical protein [Sphingobium sp. AP50]|uniref:hypothetical protein n=1 Tax=Sphingobium sp. AP50 TaxID=1884369 RepID=UPI003527B013
MAFMRQDEDAADIHFEIAGYHHVMVFLREDHPLAAKAQLDYDDLIDEIYVSVGRRSAPALRSAIDGLVPDLRRSPERLELATGDRRDDQAYRRVQAGGGADCADQRIASQPGRIGFGDREVDAG